MDIPWRAGLEVIRRREYPIPARQLWSNAAHAKGGSDKSSAADRGRGRAAGTRHWGTVVDEVSRAAAARAGCRRERAAPATRGAGDGAARSESTRGCSELRRRARLARADRESPRAHRLRTLLAGHGLRHPGGRAV